MTNHHRTRHSSRNIKSAPSEFHSLTQAKDRCFFSSAIDRYITMRVSFINMCTSKGGDYPSNNIPTSLKTTGTLRAFSCRNTLKHYFWRCSLRTQNYSTPIMCVSASMRNFSTKFSLQLKC